jgi:hypothetical protein
VQKGTTICIITKGAGDSEKVTALKVSRQCPLVLLVKLDWNQAKALGSEAGGIVDSDLLGERWRGKKFIMWAEVCVWRVAAF